MKTVLLYSFSHVLHRFAKTNWVIFKNSFQSFVPIRLLIHERNRVKAELTAWLQPAEALWIRLLRVDCRQLSNILYCTTTGVLTGVQNIQRRRAMECTRLATQIASLDIELCHYICMTFGWRVEKSYRPPQKKKKFIEHGVPKHIGWLRFKKCI